MMDFRLAGWVWLIISHFISYCIGFLIARSIWKKRQAAALQRFYDMRAAYQHQHVEHQKLRVMHYKLIDLLYPIVPRK